MFSDELICLEIQRYRPTPEPVTELEVEECKSSFVNLTEEQARVALEYLKGRSYYWSRLMYCLDMHDDTKPDELDVSRLLGNPNFEIGIMVAMRQLGKPITNPPEQQAIPDRSKSKPKQRKR